MTHERPSDSGDSHSGDTSSDNDGEIGGHDSVIAVPGSPPWFNCEVCGASRSVHDGLRELPCEPGRYDWSEEADATKRITVGDVVPVRIDQVLEPASFPHVDIDEEDCVTQILAYTHGTGVPVGIDIDKPEVSIERGDEVEVRIEEILENSATGTIDHVISTDGRVLRRLLSTSATKRVGAEVTKMNNKRENALDLPPEPDTPIKSVRDQLADLDEVENAKIVTNLYGPAVTSPPPDTTYRIAVLLRDASAYEILFSRQNGWENVEEIEVTGYWNQHTLTTALD